jgi:SAM-dependent methyltransferase
MQTALVRWQEILTARARQMDEAYARLGRSSSDFWDRRARNYHRSTQRASADNPLLQRISEVITPESKVLDIGAGTGRYALALAPLVKHVYAVEPNASMLSYLQADAQAAGIANISSVTSTWQEADPTLSADVSLCSHVLYPILDLEHFLTRLHKATRQSCFLFMRATSFDEISDPLWRRFHGEPRCLPPGYIHALDVLYEMGIYANVEVVSTTQSMSFASLEEAVAEMREQLILPEDPEITEELRGMLASWLVEQEAMLTFPLPQMSNAIISWRTDS